MMMVWTEVASSSSGGGGGGGQWDALGRGWKSGSNHQLNYIIDFHFIIQQSVSILQLHKGKSDHAQRISRHLFRSDIASYCLPLKNSL